MIPLKEFYWNIEPFFVCDLCVQTSEDLKLGPIIGVRHCTVSERYAATPAPAPHATATVPFWLGEGAHFPCAAKIFLLFYNSTPWYAQEKYLF